MGRENREATAHHEAGHALIYVLDRKHIEYVTIKKEGGYCGRTKGQDNAYCLETNPTRHNIDAAMVQRVAGGVAELIYLRKGLEMGDVLPEGSGRQSDRAIVEYWAGQVTNSMLLSHPRARAWAEALMALAESRVCQHWSAVQKLACGLLESQQIDGAEAERILRENPSGGDPGSAATAEHE